MSAESLENAIAYAVDEGRQAATELRRRVDRGSRELEEAIRRLDLFWGGDGGPDPDANEPDSVVVACETCGKANRIPLARLDRKPRCGACHRRFQIRSEFAQGLAERSIRRFVGMVGDHRRRIDEMFARQHAALDHFNLVFFGRTGVGKSTLLEAFSRGDGQAVSHSESDCTQEVRPVDWRSCRLIDTPGIAGWGRGMARSTLEERARAAVEVADVVLLCFDTQSQQAGEFQRVAEWVHAYGKPVVAILNCRNQRWRKPLEVVRKTIRRSLSGSVVEHVGHIRDELARLGLGGTPIVAVSAKLALFARAREPFQGPDARTLQKQRAEHGTRKLERWSNVEALEDLLVTAIHRDAAGLRVAMLRREVRAELSDVATSLAGVEQSSRAGAEGLDTLVEATLRVIGYPRIDVDGSRAAFRDARVADDLLSELERLRGSPFQAAARGELQIYAGQLLEARLSPLRTRSLDAAESAIEEGFRDRREISPDEFQRRTFDVPSMEAIAREVITEAQAFLSRKVRLAASDVRMDLEYQAAAVRIAGAAGAGSKTKGGWHDAASLTANAVSTATLFFPPLIGVSIGSLLVGLVFGWLGRRARRKTEEERAQARREALDSARRSIHGVYEGIGAAVTAKIADLARNALAKVLIEPIRTAVALRSIANSGAWTGAAIDMLAREIETTDPVAILRSALRGVEEHRHAGDPAAPRKVWLGEDWIDDPHGLMPDDVEANTISDAEASHCDDTATEERLRTALLAAPSPRVGAADEWLVDARVMLAEDDRARCALDELEEIARSSPKIHFVGDYNAGKSSLIRRMLVDAGCEVPVDLAIGAGPTTSNPRAYAWEGLLLVDTPGFQSGRSADASTALRVVTDAPIVVVVLQPNLVVGDPAHLDVLFRRDRSTGRASKLERAIFVINRADELGPHPVHSPAEFARIRERKFDELLSALGARALVVDRRQIACTASDPFGLTSGLRRPSRKAYDEHRSWDGVHALALALSAAGRVRRREWVDVAILHGAMTRMAELIIELRAEEHDVARKEAWIEDTRATVEDAVVEASRLSQEIEGRFEQLVRNHAFGLLSEVLGAASDEAVAAQARRLQRWWDDPAFCADVGRWYERAGKDIDEWHARSDEALGRRITSLEFRRAFPDDAAVLQTDELAARPQGFGKIVSVLKEGAKALSNRNILYGAVKTLGGKFAPWGVIKWTGRFAVAAKVLGPIGLAIDVFDFFRAGKAEEKREKARRETVEWVHESTVRIIEDVLRKPDDGQGPVAYLAVLGGQLASMASTFEAERAVRRMEREALAAQRATYEKLLRSAEEKLGLEGMRMETDHE